MPLAIGPAFPPRVVLRESDAIGLFRRRPARRSFQRGEPGGQAIQEQPGPPRKTSQTIAPSYPIPKKKEHNKRREYPMRQKSIGAVTGFLSLFTYVAANERAHHDRQDRKNKCDGNIEHAPPFWEGRGVFSKASDNGKRRRNQEHDRSRDGKPTTP